MLDRMDDYLIKRYQRLTNKFQVCTGKTNFWLAKILAEISFVMHSFLQITWFVRDKGILTKTIDAFVLIVGLGAFLVMRKACERREAESFSEKGVMNDAVLKHQRLRLWIIFLSSFTLAIAILGLVVSIKILEVRGCIIFSASAVMNVSLISSAYFYACTPLPPQKSKLKEWFRSFFKKPITQSAGAES